ncbi:MAG: endonuclease/exonuclease/phosphatase family protein [Maribacter dokdonensis]|uniref:endonuclease/exonuclease/phosphatase family protein n=1 Tax=Maribacter dokdonensis TaxID=320912 RepID=UPI00329682EE
MKKLSFFNKTMWFLNVIATLTLFLACIVPYTSIASLAFIGLSVPALVIINMLFVLYWVLVKKLYLFLSLSILVFGYFTLGSFIGFNSEVDRSLDDEAISLLSYNVLGFHGKNYDKWQISTSKDIIEFVEKENPSIICFQEFRTFFLKKDMLINYPYIANNFENQKENISVNLAVYSKFRVINSGKLVFPNTYNGGLFVDMIVQNDTVRVFNLHLQSLAVRPNNLKYERSYPLFVRLRDSFIKQQQQGEIVRGFINESPYKVIVAGDFNNTQFSKVYFNIKGNLKDSFLEAGHGYGETIKFWKFPFRIDMILTDPSFEVVSHKNYKINISDHEPIMATIKIP